MMKNTPGPLAPPDNSLPSLKMTALSYSWTTFTTNIKESGRETRMRNKDPIVMTRAQIPGPSSQPAETAANYLCFWLLDLPFCLSPDISLFQINNLSLISLTNKTQNTH